MKAETGVLSNTENPIFIFLPECDTMAPENVNYAKGETPMTDQQFAAYVELRDKYEALLELRIAPIKEAEDAISDYQFKRYEQLRDECEGLKAEIAMLRKENADLSMQLDMLKYSIKSFK